MTRLGPVRLGGSTVIIRLPRLSDHAAWREIRLRDRPIIEPFWYSSELEWSRRHTEAQWVREVLLARAEARAGRRLAGAIEIDGRLAGQCELCAVDLERGTAEMSIWIDSTLARHGFGGLAAAMVADHGLGALGLHRIVAPISPDNRAAAAGAAEIGFQREALMARYFDAGGARRDHTLWALTRAEMPPGGFVTEWLGRIRAKGPAPQSIPDPSPTPARSPHPILVGLVAARLAAGRIRCRLRALRAASPVRLEIPGAPGAVLRTRRASDGPGWRAACPPHRAPLDGKLDRTRIAWWREFARSRGGLRSPGGLVLVLDMDGHYAGEARLFDLDMFDRNARMFVWVDPARADDGVRAAATRVLLTHAFDQLGLYRVAAEIDSADAESAAVAARAGLLKEGIMRDHSGPTGRRADHALWALTIGERG